MWGIGDCLHRQGEVMERCKVRKHKSPRHAMPQAWWVGAGSVELVDIQHNIAQMSCRISNCPCLMSHLSYGGREGGEMWEVLVFPTTKFSCHAMRETGSHSFSSFSEQSSPTGSASQCMQMCVCSSPAWKLGREAVKAGEKKQAGKGGVTPAMPGGMSLSLSHLHRRKKAGLVESRRWHGRHSRDRESSGVWERRDKFPPSFPLPSSFRLQYKCMV